MVAGRAGVFRRAPASSAGPMAAGALAAPARRPASAAVRGSASWSASPSARAKPADPIAAGALAAPARWVRPAIRPANVCACPTVLANSAAMMAAGDRAVPVGTGKPVPRPGNAPSLRRCAGMGSVADGCRRLAILARRTAEAAVAMGSATAPILSPAAPALPIVVHAVATDSASQRMGRRAMTVRRTAAHVRPNVVIRSASRTVARVARTAP